MKINNRSDGTVAYSLPELNNTRRIFEVGNSKDIEVMELEALFQSAGGAELLKHVLQVEDKEWVMKHWNAPQEYFWTMEEIKNCLINDSLELFSETLDYAPDGVLDLIKYFAWKIPLTDLNKIQVIQTKLGFNVLAAVDIMTELTPTVKPEKKERLRKED